MGWYCFLGVCTPQLPSGHSCSGLHGNECLSGFGCNLALETPRCIREYSLATGSRSSSGRLCMTNYVDLRRQECAELPEIELEDGKPRVSGRGCRADADCPRSDTSFGACVCKQWWEGSDPPGYCELSVSQAWRPAFKRFWEESAAYCHHNWSEDRCAAELKMEEVLAEVRADAAAISADPTEVKSCARELLTTWVPTGRARAQIAPGVATAMGLFTFSI